MSSIRTGLGNHIQNNNRPDQAEHEMCKAIDEMRLIRKYQSFFDKLTKGTLDMPGVLRELAPAMVKGLLTTLENEKTGPKLRTQIQQDMLDRAGYGKISKAFNVNTTIDVNTTKRELINLIKTKAKKAGVIVKDVEYVDEDGPTIDVSSEPIVRGGSDAARAYSEPNEIRGEDSEPASDDSSDKAGDL